MRKCLERVTGLEPVSQPWEGRIIPLYYTRNTYTECAWEASTAPASLTQGSLAGTTTVLIPHI